jgi:hypothetical protein
MGVVALADVFAEQRGRKGQERHREQEDEIEEQERPVHGVMRPKTS